MYDEKILKYISKQKSLDVSDEDVKKQLLNLGWSGEQADEALAVVSAVGVKTQEKNKKENAKGDRNLLILLIFVAIGIILNLGLNLYNMTLTKKPYVIDIAIQTKNDELLAKIEDEEQQLHNILHKDMVNGLNPLTKEIALIFRTMDLLHLQGRLNLIAKQIDEVKEEANYYTQADVDKMQISMRNTQKSVEEDLKDKTHDSSIDPAWLVQ